METAAIEMDSHVARASGAACRRRQRRLRSWDKHDPLIVAMDPHQSADVTKTKKVVEKHPNHASMDTEERDGYSVGGGVRAVRRPTWTDRTSSRGRGTRVCSSRGALWWCFRGWRSGSGSGLW